MFRHTLLALAWFVASLVAAYCAGTSAYENPEQFSRVVDLIATIISILVGVSLAIIAVLVSPFSVSSVHAKDSFEADRINKVVKENDSTLAYGQTIFFFLYLLALLSAVAFRWSYNPDAKEFSLIVKLLSSLAAFLGVFSLCWSVRLPFILSSVARQRNELGN